MLVWCLTLISVQTQLTNGNRNGSSQVCSSSVSRGLAITGDIDVQVDISIPDPVCIRCGYLDGITVVLVTDTDDVTYNTGGNVIVNTTDISVTNDGLLLEDPGKSFFDETSIVCIFNGPTGPAVSCTITIEHLLNNPPTLNPDGGDDRTVDVIEGSNITLTCTRDTNNAPGDLYQWIHPDGQMTPRAPTDSPVSVTVNSITREGSGMYICQGSRNGITDSALSNNMTLNVQYPALELSVLPNNCSLAVDTTLVLNCTFVSNPTPNNILWTHNGTTLFPESNPNLSQMDAKNYSLLKVYLVSISSGGQYKCIVNNSFGIDQTGSTFITVQVSPDPVHNLKNTSSDSQSITLTWEFGFNGNANISGVNVTYYARNTTINDTQYMMNSTKSLQTLLKLLNLQPKTVYVVIVRVRNSVSSEVGLSQPVNVTVETKPRETNRTVNNSVFSVNPAAYLLPLLLIALVVIAVLTCSAVTLSYKQFSKSSRHHHFENRSSQLSNNYCETEDFVTLSSETATYATVMGGKIPPQSKPVPPEYETLPVKDESLRDAASAETQRNLDKMMDSPGIPTYATVTKKERPVKPDNEKQSEEGIDEVPPPVIPYDFTVDEPQQLETQYVTEIEEMTEEPTERLVKETNMNSSYSSTKETENKAHADLEEISKKSSKKRAIPEQVIYSTVITEKPHPPLPTYHLLMQVEDGQLQDDTELKKLSTSGDIPVKKLAETAITKLI